ncbi:MAG: PEGA domain-containing protein [Acidobacteriota bacterium]
MIVALLAAVAAVYVFYPSAVETPPSQEALSETAPVSEADAAREAEGDPAPAARPRRPTTGSLAVEANIQGVAVYLDGQPVGETPYRGTHVKIGRHEVRVEKEGYQPYLRHVQVRPGREVTLYASLRPAMASLRIESDVSGASVFIDREYVGLTPVEVTDLEPGSHQVMVSMEGYDVYAESLELGRGLRDVVVQFRVSKLDESIEVVHKHRFGSCSGKLSATTDGLGYETDNKKDRFTAAFSDLERFQIDYLQKNLRLKIRRGRNYNFTHKNGNADLLFIFHQQVERFLKKKETEAP